MEITPSLKRLALGEAKTFSMSAYDSVLTVTSRLKRTGHGAFTLKRSDELLTVTRIAEPSVFKTTPDPRGVVVRRAKETIEELDWRALQSDPDVEMYEVHVAIITPGHTRRIKIPLKDKFPAMCATLSTFIKTYIITAE